jgi:hypothetical protein
MRTARNNPNQGNVEIFAAITQSHRISRDKTYGAKRQG